MLLAALFSASLFLSQDLPDATGTAIARPTGEAKLDPTTGSYFQVFEFFGRPPHTWEHAQRMVRGYFHEKREGRLAHVKDIDTHYFLILQFPELRNDKLWIGLSATCAKKVEYYWIDGTKLEDTPFRAWANGAQTKIHRDCNRNRGSFKELPIYYEATDFGVRWQTGEPRTNLVRMLVEFPDPEKLEKETGSNQAENQASSEKETEEKSLNQ